MNFSKVKLYEQWQLLRLYGVLNSPHLVLIYPVYTIQLKSMCLPYFENYLDNGNSIEDAHLKTANPRISRGIIYNLSGLKLVFDSLRCIYNEEGYWGLYRGFLPMTLHSYLTRMIHDQLIKIYKRHSNKIHDSYIKSAYVKNSTKYIAEVVTYPLLVISTQQAIFDVKRYNLGIQNDQDRINEPVIGIYSLVQLSINSEEGITSLWKGITAHIMFKVTEDLIKNYLYSYLYTNFCSVKDIETRKSTTTVKPNNKKHLKHGISNFITSLLSPLALISTVKRCQTNDHIGLCRGDVGIKEILGNVNWGIYFGQMVVNSVFIAIYLFDGENCTF
ncbi:mitochondrial FAD carrier protein [Cryptosporidium ubiquitum]|uniref:Mitochondrial FAD carrier protein n=1 Tax=Cryptosporidium ubiquitum TaxID=857276 RepID=A0A1J4MFY0_9CRYT|nr:mitochondrial FAD carrier protein [Cryptosporidium ubiquitum]OII73128.1 mitochondrial FAD carrier protein [Cryptosporidium ubiquitum]